MKSKARFLWLLNMQVCGPKNTIPVHILDSEVAPTRSLSNDRAMSRIRSTEGKSKKKKIRTSCQNPDVADILGVRFLINLGRFFIQNISKHGSWTRSSFVVAWGTQISGAICSESINEAPLRSTETRSRTLQLRGSVTSHEC